ncbi:3-hydroxyacyl-CoA dehydrogenase family protein [Streptomyces sp. NPDC090052]|uniref:3-hydroxyacyl-CoA dehydrogenase family protein n=1 Tax=unclassified Streptomyces TaxID=2593676 RepID=UPI00225B1AFA|nr:3-hydroxyacyl-CoA dehydrogenase family protein [Streptomyces sp. NBC_01306]MCX4723198.1 3-hydroxyacyl-CoA dehydrogenase family protein [Streptomyces sp. NBC_01306]WSX45294.1 3-hydroxyacyl-CoA dehydrogenase family protein [Streptomyces sp. NBC_00963]
MTTDGQNQRLTILGAGVMGVNIATTALGHGIPVVLVDVEQSTLDRARTQISQLLRHAQLMGALPADTPAGELTTALSPVDGADATAVIEAITEDAALKAKVLAEVSGVIRPGTPLISNTSGIPIDELAEAVARPDELVGTHFMNPTYLIAMVEVIKGPRTSEETMAGVVGLLTAMRRRSVVVQDAPGFVTSRLLHPMINDAARLVEAGTADAEAVDALMEGCLGHPTGPLRTADLIGIDNLVDSLAALYTRTGDEGCRPCDLLLEKVRLGHNGRKSGRGFYDYGKALS